MAFADPCLWTHNAYRGDPVEATEEPTLYSLTEASASYGEATVRLALHERRLATGATWRTRHVDVYAVTVTREQARRDGVGSVVNYRILHPDASFSTSRGF